MPSTYEEREQHRLQSGGPTKEEREEMIKLVENKALACERIINDVLKSNLSQFTQILIFMTLLNLLPEEDTDKVIMSEAYLNFAITHKNWTL